MPMHEAADAERSAASGQAAPSGLVHALLLDGNGGASDFPWAELADWSPDRGCLWLHLDYEDPETQQWLQQHSGLSELSVNALLTPETRPRSLNRGDNLLLALRGINMTPGDKPDDMVSVRIWTDGRRVISTRRRQLVPTRDVVEELAAGNGPRTAAELLVTWIDRIVGHMNETVDNFEDQVLGHEEKLLDGETEGVRLRLAQLRKQTITIRRYLSPQREAMNRLLNESLSWLNEHSRLQLREINDRLIRHIEDIDEIRERAAVAQDELAARVSEQMNERSYLFTVVATVFLPLGFFTGLMGINVGGMPGVENAAAFWIVVGICLGISAGLALALRLKRWL